MLYLDHAATTPLDPAVLEAMRPYLTEHFGNASSVHALGRRARVAVEEARERVAAVLGCAPAEVVFTSGGTEADNAALRGVLAGPSLAQTGRPGLVTSAAEHEAVLRTAEALRDEGHPVTLLRPGPHGALTPAQVAEAVDAHTGLVSVMLVNNEIGTVSPVAEIAGVAHAAGALVHTDAVQAAGLLPLDVDALGVDLLALSGHKVYGPKAVGALFVRAGTLFQPLVRGGAQERRRRGGTENVAGVVGLAEALARAEAVREAEAARLARLQRRLAERIRAAFGDGVVFNTPLDGFHPHPYPAAPHVLSVSFPPRDGQAVDGEMLLLGL
ncbi:MAG TPA: cysteine desulfurase family protein, partial [Rubricoccaceae bacterium]|nr:cysteine desulfurase family protein [Rubricoccaceae bacterium]